MHGDVGKGEVLVAAVSCTSHDHQLLSPWTQIELQLCRIRLVYLLRALLLGCTLQEHTRMCQV